MVFVIFVTSQVKQAHSSVSLISANLLRPQFLVMHRLQKTCTWDRNNVDKSASHVKLSENVLQMLNCQKMFFRCWIIRKCASDVKLSEPCTCRSQPPLLHSRTTCNNRIKSDQNSETRRCTSVVAERILYLENLPTEHIASFFVLLPVPVFIKVFTVPDMSLIQKAKGIHSKT